MTRLFLILAVLISQPGPALAGSVIGTWLSPPDHKGQVGHIVLAPCGDALCGTLVRAFDRSGKPVVTRAVGRKLVWDMRPAGADLFRGNVYVPLLNGSFAAEMRMSGDRITVRGCAKAGLCQAQTWQRVK